MKTRKLGANGPELSAIGLGCMRMTPLTAQQGRAGKDEGIATIHAALDAGVTLLNTGDFYTMGANEMLVGEALRAIADRKGATPAQIAIAGSRYPEGLESHVAS